MNLETTFNGSTTRNSVAVAALILFLCPGCEYASSIELGRNHANESSRNASLENSGLENSGLDNSGDIVALPADPVIRITSPLEREVIYDEVYHDMSWVAMDTPVGKRFVVFASDNYNYYVMYPFPRSGNSPGSYLQKNIRLATEGDDWQLHVCLASERAMSTLRSCVNRGEWAFPELPDGVQCIESVPVERRRQ